MSIAPASAMAGASPSFSLACHAQSGMPGSTHPRYSIAPYRTPPRLLRLHLADAVFHDERLTVGVADCLLHGMQVAGVEDEPDHIGR